MAMIIDRQTIRGLKRFAEENVISSEEAMKIYRKEAKCVGDRPGYSILIPVKYRLVYSIEWTPSVDMKKKFKLRRMSVSVVNGDPSRKWVNNIALGELMKELGFHTSSLDDPNINVTVFENDKIPNICVSEVIEISTN